MKEYLIGSISGIFEVIITHPIDYIKTKRQELSKQRLNTLQFYKKIYDNNILNFYTGVRSRLIGIMPMRFVFWGVQENTYLFLKKNNINTKFNNLIIGTNAGFFQSIIDNQIELFKIAKITNQKLDMNNLLKFKGFYSNLYRNCIFSNSISYACLNKNFDNNFYKFITASTAGAIGSILSQPFDVVKTIKHSNINIFFDINVKNKNTIEIINLIYQKNPYLLFTGGFYRCVLSYFSMGVGFVMFDLLYKN